LAEFLLQISVGLVFLAVIFCVIRLVIGRSLLDRIVAMDMLTIIAIVLISLYAHFAGRFVYVDVALVYGLLSFLSVLAVARFIDKGL
jgi:multicomponent Na+:H+ antiporter subunit F